MKKSLLLVLALLLSFTLYACDRGDREAPVIEGADDVTIYLDEDFDPMDGVTATDHDGNDITDEITIIGEVKTDETGTYYLRYRVEDDRGYSTEAPRYVTVEVDPDQVGDEMVPNGDFSLGMNFWSTTTGLEGGTGNFEVVDGELKIEILSVSGGMWEPRLENIGIEFEEDQAYRVTFKARAEEPRAVHVQVGELLPAAPWFTNFKPAVPVIVDLDEEMRTYSFEFIMSEETSDNGALIFEFGTVPGTVGTDNLMTTVYLDDVMIEEIDELEETLPPVIQGVDDVEVTLGEEFDPLAGVSAIDSVDGTIELTLDNVTGEVNTDELGEYELTYTVTNSAGDEAVEARIVTVVEPVEDLPIGADFGWRLFVNDWEGTQGELEVIDGQLVASLSDINTSANWNIQIIQDAEALRMAEEEGEGSLQLEAGRTYRVSFDAKASVTGDIAVAFGHEVGGWHEYHIEEGLSISTDMETISFEFETDEEGDYDMLSMFKLEMGLLFEGEDGTQTFTLDNVMIEVLEDDEFVDAELIVNGTFEEPDEALRLPAYGWRGFFNDWEGTVGDLSIIENALVLELHEINVWENWQVQIIQDAYALGTGEDNEGSIEFEEGATYRVSFDAKATTSGMFTVAIGHAGGGWTPYHMEDLEVSKEMQTFEFEFTLDDDDEDYDVLAQFKLEMGNLFAGLSGTQSFTLDNLSLEVLDDDDFVDAELLVNADFDQYGEELSDWRAFLNDWEGTTGALYKADEQLLLVLESINVWENWQIQVIQDAFALGTGEDNEGSIEFEEGATYRVRFDAKASVEGSINLAIGHSEDGWTPYHMEELEVTREMQSFEVEFTLDDDDMDYDVLGQFKLEMGMLFSGLDAPQSFTLDNVIIEIKDGDDFVDAELIENGDFTE